MNERDPELEALWRAQSAETPPSSLDDAIRAAAHRAVNARPVAAARARAPWPAWAPLAAAASIGVIAIGVWQLQPKDTDVMSTTVTDVPARVAPPPRASASTSSAVPARSPALESRDTTATAERKDEAVAPSASAGTTGSTAAADRKAEAPAPTGARNEADARGSVADAPAALRKAPAADAKRVAPAQPPEAMVAPPAPSAPAANVPAANVPAANAPASTPPMAMVAPPPSAGAPIAIQPRTSGALSDKRASNAGVRAPAPPAQEAGAIAGSGKDASASAQMAARPAPSEGGNAPMRSKAATQTDAMERASPAPSPAASPMARPADNARSVSSYVDAIRHALDAHQIDLAVAQLTAMRAQYPDADAKLPMELRVWAATVPRDNP